jgi:hypothetical protein
VPDSLIDLAGLRVGAEDFLAAVLSTAAQPIWVVESAAPGLLRYGRAVLAAPVTTLPTEVYRDGDNTSMELVVPTAGEPRRVSARASELLQSPADPVERARAVGVLLAEKARKVLG